LFPDPWFFVGSTIYEKFVPEGAAAPRAWVPQKTQRICLQTGVKKGGAKREKKRGVAEEVFGSAVKKITGRGSKSYTGQKKRAGDI